MSAVGEKPGPFVASLFTCGVERSGRSRSSPPRPRESALARLQSPDAYTITPCGLQLAPPKEGTSASVRGGPPERSTVFSLPPALKPIERPSGDQKGSGPPRLPASGCAVVESSERIQSCGEPSADRAANTRRRPSRGENFKFSLCGFARAREYRTQALRRFA